MPIVLDGTQGISTPMYAGSISSNPVTPSVNMKNRIINGNCVIDQRNAGASVTATGSPFSVDRWQATVSQAAKFTIQQNAGAVTPPVGFTNYVGVTSSSAYSVLTGDYFILNQTVEGFNIADLGWGTANAKTITISFWVRSSLTGTFGLALSNQDWNYSYPASYTISVANTWEYKTVTIAGPTAGTWNTNNNGGVRVQFGLGVGSTYNGTAGSWASAQYLGTTGATSVVGTNGATFYITGVQLEVGSTATSFDYRPFGTELALCQRYYQFVGGEAVYQFVGTGMNYATNSSSIQIPILVRFRAIPSIGVSSVSHWAITYASGAQAVATSITDDQSGTTTVNVGVVVTGTPLTNGGAAKLIATNTLSARLTMSAEL